MRDAIRHRPLRRPRSSADDPDLRRLDLLAAQEIPLLAEIHDPPDPDPGPEALAIGRLTAADVRRRLATAAPPRPAIFHALLAGLSQTAIAARLDLSRPAVNRHVKGIRARARKILCDRGR